MKRCTIGFSNKNSESSVAHSKRVFDILNSFSTHSDKDIQKIYQIMFVKCFDNRKVHLNLTVVTLRGISFV